MSSFSELLHNYNKSFGSWVALEELSKALAGRRVFHRGHFRTIVSVSSFVGGPGIYFGGPARGEDQGDTWIYLSEVVEQNGKLVHQPRSQDFEAGVQHERARVGRILRAFQGLPGIEGGPECALVLAQMIEKGEDGVDTPANPE